MTTQGRHKTVPLGKPVLLEVKRGHVGGGSGAGPSDKWLQGTPRSQPGGGKPVCHTAGSFQVCSVCERLSPCALEIVALGPWIALPKVFFVSIVMGIGKILKVIQPSQERGTT